MGIREYIVESFSPTIEKKKYRWKDKKVEVDDSLPDSVDLKEVFRMVDVMIPSSLTDMINSVKIGDYSRLNTRGVDALLDDSNNLIITSDQKDNYDLMCDIVHEIAHIVEDKMAYKIYNDESIKREFANKRKALRDRLRQEGYDVSQHNFLKLKYDESLDNFLWREVGYDVLAQLGHDLFLSPYAATSIREYWADAFEDYFLKNKKKLKMISPSLYKKLEELF